MHIHRLNQAMIDPAHNYDKYSSHQFAPTPIQFPLIEKWLNTCLMLQIRNPRNSGLVKLYLICCSYGSRVYILYRQYDNSNNNSNSNNNNKQYQSRNRYKYNIQQQRNIQITLIQKQKMNNQQKQPAQNPTTKSFRKQQSKTKRGDSGQKQQLMEKLRKRKINKQPVIMQPQENKLTQQVGKYQIDMDSEIGRGAYGLVYKAHLIEKPEESFACKIISKSRLQRQNVYGTNTAGKTITQRLKDQIQTQKKLWDCQYVVRLYDFIYDQTEGYYLFMELCQKNLGKLIEKKPLPQSQALNYFKQLLKGYKRLYDDGISHRDLKPQNLLLKGDNLKIADFGLVKIHTSAELVLRSAQKGANLAQSFAGSINYISPDILNADKQSGSGYDPFLSDVWSMGIILYKMLYGVQPYQAQDAQILLKKIESVPLKIPSQPKVSESTLNLLKQMIQKDLKQRIDFKTLYAQLIKNELLGVNEDPLKQKEISERQKLLQFYNILITKISYDSAHHATLRQIGIEDYQKYSYRLMTLIHEKRMQGLKSLGKDLRQEMLHIKSEIINYNDHFHKAIKQTCQLQKQKQKQKSVNLLSQLKKFKDKLKSYQQLQLLHHTMQYYLLLLLLLYNLQAKQVTVDYIYTIVSAEKDNKLTLQKLEKITLKNLEEK